MSCSIVNVVFEKDTASTSATSFNFPRQLNGRVGLAGTAITAEFLLTAVGSADASLVAGAKYIAMWYFSANDTLHSSNHKTNALGTMGAWSNYLLTFNTSSTFNNPTWTFTPNTALATKWVLKGSIWMTTTIDIS